MNQLQMTLRCLPYTLVLIIPGAAAVGLTLGGPWTFFAPLVAFVLIPLADLVLGVSRTNVPVDRERRLARFPGFDAILWGCLPLQVALLVVALEGASLASWTPLEWAGNALSVGISGGAMGITVAHELVHRRGTLDSLIGWLLLVPVWYTHWAIEHVAGHHRHVSTPGDPASARKGETVYRFLPRTILGTVVSAWRLEATRLGRKQRHWRSPRNRFLRGLGGQVVVTVSVFTFLGPMAGLFLLSQALVAILLLEVINYVEHYGLARRQLANGEYERVTHHHSWNASQRLTNWLLFHLQRHSDHHAFPGRRFPILRHFDDSPQLPTGYAGMLLLALVPPLWFAVMNPRIPQSADALKDT